MWHRLSQVVLEKSSSIHLSNAATERRLRFFGCTSHAVLLMKTISVQLLLQFASLHPTGNDLQEDPTTRGSEPLNPI